MSSILGVGASLMAAGTADGRLGAALPLRGAADAVDGVVEAAAALEALAGAELADAGRAAAAVAAFVFPLAPTVVQAPPTSGCVAT